MALVLLCTDEPITAVGLRTVIQKNPELALIGVCEQVLRLVSECKKAKPDLLILQVSPEVNIRMLDTLRRSIPDCRIVLLVRELSLCLAAQAVNIGVAGILRRSMSLELVEKCLLRVAVGETWFEKDLIVKLLSAKTVSLTPRERQLVSLLAQGLCNKEIGNILDLKEGTVKVYLSKLYKKAGVSDRLELALVGIRNLGLGGFESDEEPPGFRSIFVRPAGREDSWPLETKDRTA